jgi:6-phosphofructokinase
MKSRETRCCVLDRILPTRFGPKAVQLLNEGYFCSVVSYQNYQVQHVPIADTVNWSCLVQPSSQTGQTTRDVEISFGEGGL